MKLRDHTTEEKPEPIALDDHLPLALDELVREGARRMLVAALEAEVDEYVRRHHDARDERGHAQVVRNGRSRPRNITTGAGTLTVRAPRVNDKRVVDGERQRFTSRILPPYLRRSKSIEEVLPALYLRGLSTGDFEEALRCLLGEDAALSPSTISRLITGFGAEYETWRTRSLADRDYVYMWADGVHLKVRLGEENVAALVVIGARPDGTKEVIAIEGGYSESTEHWLEILRNLRSRGMRAPAIAVADGARGFWLALREVFPETRSQRCWVHKRANVLGKIPRKKQDLFKQRFDDIAAAETRAEALGLIGQFEADYGAKYDKAVKSLTDGLDELLAYFDFPADHWKHLRTTNPIESTFATVKHRTRQTKGAGSRKAGLAMAFKLLLAAEKRWRRLDNPQLLPLVRAGVVFADGEQVERTDRMPQAVAAPDTAIEQEAA